MTDMQVYIVRVWRTDGATPRFRASARAVDREQPRCFDSAGELAAFLASEPADAPRPAGKTDPDEPPRAVRRETRPAAKT